MAKQKQLRQVVKAKSRKRALARKRAGTKSEDELRERISQMKDWNEFVPAFRAISDNPELKIKRSDDAYRETVRRSFSWWVLLFGQLPVSPRNELKRLIKMLGKMAQTIPTKKDLEFMAIDVLRGQGKHWDEICRHLISGYASSHDERYLRNKLANDFSTWKTRKANKTKPKTSLQKPDLL